MGKKVVWAMGSAMGFQGRRVVGQKEEPQLEGD